MRISRLAIATALCFLAGEATPLIARPAIERQAPPTCTTVNRQDIEKTGTNSISDVVNALPKVAQPTCPPAKTVPQVGLATPLTPWDQSLLDIQNRERALVGAVPLRWNVTLANDATYWAGQMARTGQEVHAPREGRGIERENLQKGLIGWGPDRMIQDWILEKRDFRAGYFPDVALDGNWVNVSHYTQIIWPTTTDVGCGMVQGGGFSWLVCRYSPGGNKDGKPVGYGASGIPERG